MKTSLKNKSGISLIVLVITIIVMIILAAAIILSLSSSGIIGKANQAKTDTDAASAKELASMAVVEWELMTEAERNEAIGESGSEEVTEAENLKTYVENKLGVAGYDVDKIVVNEDGTIEDCIAMIGTDKYTTLKAAIEAVTVDKTSDEETGIKLLNDVNVTETIELLNGQVIKLDLNGHKISSVGIDIIKIYGFDILTIVDTSTAKTGMIIAESDKSKYIAKYDTNNDGVISPLDYEKLARHIGKLEFIEEGSEEYEFYDVNNTGVIDLADLSDYALLENDVFAFINNNRGELNFKISEDKVKGAPIAISSNGIVTWE